jgi:hypothetical protein
MRSLLYFIVSMGLFWGCKDFQKEVQELQDPGWQVAPAALPALKPLNAKAKEVMLSWKEYQAFEASFLRIYDTEFREDFVLALEDLIEKQKQWEAAAYPEKFDTPQVKSRQKVLKTYLLKTKGNLEYREPLEPTIKEMIHAFNALRSQFNSLMNYTLPDDLIKVEGESKVQEP